MPPKEAHFIEKVQSFYINGVETSRAKRDPILFNQNATISDDHSEGSSIQQRKLLALQDHDYGLTESLFELPKPLDGSIPVFNPSTYLQPIGSPDRVHAQRLKPNIAPTQQALPMRHQNMPNKQQQENMPRQPLRQMHYYQSQSREGISDSPLPVAQVRADNKGSYHQSSIDTIDTTEGYSFSSFKSHIAYLEAKIHDLEAGINESAPSRHQVLYRLFQNDESLLEGKDQEFEGRVYLDLPEQMQDQQGDAYLRCSVPVVNLELYVATNPDISFIIFHDYPRKISRSRISLNNCTEGATRTPEPQEALYPVSNELKKALSVMLDSGTEYEDVKKEYQRTKELSAPYLFFYHNRNKLNTFQERLSKSQWDQLELLVDYVRTNFYSEYDTVDSLLEKREIVGEFVHYLFKPGDILVSRESEEYRGYIAKSWVKPRKDENTDQGYNIMKMPMAGRDTELWHRQSTQSWGIDAETWDFDGNFYAYTEEVTFDIPLSVFSIDAQNRRKTNKVNITSLNVFPIRFASEELVGKLRKRGETLWKCRTQRLVSYQASERERLDNKTDDRYMIDMKSYKYLYPNNSKPVQGRSNSLDSKAMLNDDPPSGPFVFLMPQTIKGYNLRRKTWFDISIDHISDVTWNKQAFNSLVIDRKSKDFIQALVSNHLESEKSTDLISGKGSGLILLLHGGPGTGKTLTAESVAEIAEKPLYRVTCGDVGIKPGKVEKYLDSVLHLGKLWGCVVLLDEADVFLEQRSLEDLARNALVSVFLRVLEYYDGILILTSNRVGTFDEAFRSRIQLALHYPSLGPLQRYKIWQTLIARLKSMEGEAIDIDDIEYHLEELKEEKLNGRQIRNVITTARQYARWKKTALTYDHLKDAMEVSGRFNTYLDQLHQGYTADEIAQDEGLRLA